MCLSDQIRSVAQLCMTLATSWTVAHQAPLSMGFPRQEYWSGLPFPPPRDPSDPRIKPVSPVSLALEGKFFTLAIYFFFSHPDYRHSLLAELSDAFI